MDMSVLSVMNLGREHVLAYDIRNTASSGIDRIIEFTNFRYLQIRFVRSSPTGIRNSSQYIRHQYLESHL